MRFFDDGEVFDHFAGLGIFLGNDHDTELLSAIAASSGASFTDTCEIEIRAVPEQTQAAFAKYMAAMFASISWEKAWEAKFDGELHLSVMK